MTFGAKCEKMQHDKYDNIGKWRAQKIDMISQNR